jgi:Leucine-rich repeat (LRR) protein
MKFSKLIIVLIVLSLQQEALAGFGVGRGGDLIHCRSINGINDQLVSLDYALTANEDHELVEIDDAESSAILQLLNKATPELGRSFELFLSFRANRTDLTKARIWIDTPSRLVDISDEDLHTSRIPDSCDKTKITQAVIRTKGDYLITYHYDHQLLESLKNRSLMQYSFLLVHEWLWELTDDVRVVRMANHFLHLKSTQQLDELQFRTALSRMEISVDGPIFNEVCERSTAVRQTIENALNLPCDKISYDTLRLWAQPWEHPNQLGVTIVGEELIFKDVDRVDSLDLTGLEQLHYLKFNGGSIDSFPAGILKPLRSLKLLSITDLASLDIVDFDLFAPLIALENLTINNTRLRNIPRPAFRDLKNLRMMNLASNQISHVWEDWFEGLPRLDALSLALNKIEHLSGYEFDGLSKIKTIALNGNKLASLGSKQFANNPFLRNLWLNDNVLEDLPQGLFANNTSLSAVLLNNNRLENIPDGLFSASKHLGYLNLSQNQLTTIGTGNIQSHQEPFLVNLSHNYLRDYPPIGIDGLTQQITELDLSYNLLNHFPAKNFNDVSIEDLKLQNNKIVLNENSDSYEGIYVKRLDLRGNQIKQIPDSFWSIFVGCNQSECLVDLRNNPLDTDAKKKLADLIAGGLDTKVLYDR